jgi:hypothetical protein
VIEQDDKSYRFRAKGVWLKDDNDDYRIGLELIGMPVCLHKVSIGKHEDVVEKISAAA